MGNYPSIAIEVERDGRVSQVLVGGENLGVKAMTVGEPKAGFYTYETDQFRFVMRWIWG